jgi:deazaflavin-dependent oxidoreductase (nitroreductase family)
MADRPLQSLPLQRRHRRPHLYGHAAGLPGDEGPIAAADGDSYIIVASKGGAPVHPSWYKNLVAHPEVEVQVGTKKLKAKARTASGDERARLWEKALKFWPPYADYVKKTERQIPVVVLDPIA